MVTICRGREETVWTGKAADGERESLSCQCPLSPHWALSNAHRGLAGTAHWAPEPEYLWSLSVSVESLTRRHGDLVTWWLMNGCTLNILCHRWTMILGLTGTIFIDFNEKQNFLENKCESINNEGWNIILRRTVQCHANSEDQCHVRCQKSDGSYPLQLTASLSRHAKYRWLTLSAISDICTARYFNVI